jgi:hypothetical protein
MAIACPPGRDSADAFAEGLYSVIPQRMLAPFSADEFSLLLNGTLRKGCNGGLDQIECSK